MHKVGACLAVSILGCVAERSSAPSDADADVDVDSDADADCASGCRELLASDGSATGLEFCAGTGVHRLAAVTCLENPPGDCAEDSATCTTDAECADVPSGACAQFYMNCECVQGCRDDDDCAAGEACVCAGSNGPFGCASTGPLSRCLPANCRTDDDCFGERCTLYREPESCNSNYVGLACQTKLDECQGDADCTGQFCSFESGNFRCVDFPGACE